MVSFLKVQADSGPKEMGGEGQVPGVPTAENGGCPLPSSALPEWEQCDTESLKTRPEMSHGKDSLLNLSYSLLPPQRLQQPPEKMDMKELPPEHESLKISFEALLQRCSLSATDLVSLNLSHDAPTHTPAGPRTT